MSHIYIVEDHATVQEALAITLTAKGHICIGGTDCPTKALAEILKLQPDIVLIDLTLGIRSGHELLSELHTRGYSSRVIVLSVSLKERDVDLAIRHGAQAYVLKTWPLQFLLDAIESVRSGHRHFVREVGSIAFDLMRSSHEPAGIDSLSIRERQVLIMVVKGLSSSEIGRALHLSPKTVDSYRSRLMGKLKAPDIPALVRLAIREGLIDIDG